MRALPIMALGMLLAALFAAKQASALAVINASSGLDSPNVTIDFGNGLLPHYSMITNQLSGQGVIFGENYVYYDCDCNYTAVSEAGVAVYNQAAPVGPVYFTQDVSAAVFSFIAAEGASITKFSAFRDGNLVETFNAPTDDNPYTVEHYDQTGLFFQPLARTGLGVRMQLLNAEQKQLAQTNEGVLIIAIRRESPAFKAELLPGDIVLTVGEIPIYDNDSLLGAIEKSKGREVAILLRRQRTKVTKKVLIPAGTW